MVTLKKVSNLAGWMNIASQMYGFSSITSNFMLDREGTLNAKNLRIDDLKEKWIELIPEHVQFAFRNHFIQFNTIK